MLDETVFPLVLIFVGISILKFLNSLLRVFNTINEAWWQKTYFIEGYFNKVFFNIGITNFFVKKKTSGPFINKPFLSAQSKLKEFF